MIEESWWRCYLRWVICEPWGEVRYCTFLLSTQRERRRLIYKTLFTCTRPTVARSRGVRTLFFYFTRFTEIAGIKKCVNLELSLADVWKNCFPMNWYFDILRLGEKSVCLPIRRYFTRKLLFVDSFWITKLYFETVWEILRRIWMEMKKSPFWNTRMARLRLPLLHRTKRGVWKKDKWGWV